MEVVRKQLAKLVCPRLSHVSLKELCGGRGGGESFGCRVCNKTARPNVPCLTKILGRRSRTRTKRYSGIW